MNIAATAARILLGIIFTLAGIFTCITTNPPPQPGLAGTFNDAFIHSHYSIFIGVAQLVIGVLFLLNRYVPIALIMLAAFLYNSFAFHITMMPLGLPAPIIVFVLWLIVALRYRALFACLAQ
jgi:hypothetical protein